ncbi:MAG TPA: hypothetical protein VF444_00540 [Pseudonocardiaceae bacterium]
MAEGELGAVFKALAKDADEAAGNVSESLARLSEETAEREETSLANIAENEAQTAEAFNKIARGEDPAAGVPRPGVPGGEAPTTTSSGEPKPSTAPSSFINNGKGLPGARAPDAQKLGQLDETQVTRDDDGLITHVGGTPVKDYATDLSKERAGVYVAAKNDRSLSRKAQGECISVGIDRRTGAVYEGANGRSDETIGTNEVHPTIKQNYDKIENGGPYSWEADGSDSVQVRPHPDQPLGHAEVRATNEAMWDRTKQGLSDGPETLGEIIQAPYFPYLNGGGPAPFCANCNLTLDGVESAAGRYSAFPWPKNAPPLP